MALPVVLVNSATGSDSLSSGAGPGTALNGSAASVAGTATSVSITDAVDLSGVALDGSAVLYYVDGTAGHRNFDNITNITGSSGAWTVTVANGFTTSTGPFSWAIGGKRASIGSATSKKLIENNAANGDAMPGWTVRMESGHTETITGSITFRRAGDNTNGPIIVEGDPAAVTLPILTFSNNGTALVLNAVRQVLQNFEMQNSNATKTASIAISTNSSGIHRISNIKVKDGTNKFWKAISMNTSGNCSIGNCDIANTASDGIAAGGSFLISDSWIHSCGGHGVAITGTANNVDFEDNIFSNNTTDGINDARTGTSPGVFGLCLERNTFDGNGSDGLEITANGTSVTTPFLMSLIQNNQFTRNTVYGINLSGSPAQAAIDGNGMRIRNNNFGTGALANGTAAISGSLTLDSSNLAVDPQYTNSGGNDWSVGANVKAKGYPTTAGVIGGDSSTTSYVDIGTQRQESGAAGGGANLLGEGTLVSSGG